MKILALFAILTSVCYTLKSQDIIINAQGNTINCAIQKMEANGVSFIIPPQDIVYRMAWRNIKKIYVENKWANVDSLKDVALPPMVWADTTKELSPLTSSLQIDRQRYLEKAGNNLLLGITLPIGGAIVGGSMVLVSGDNEGVEAVGYFIFGGSVLASFICDISVGVNLIKAQRQFDQLLNMNTKGFKIGAQRHGIGIGYRF